MKNAVSERTMMRCQVSEMTRILVAGILENLSKEDEEERRRAIPGGGLWLDVHSDATRAKWTVLP